MKFLHSRAYRKNFVSKGHIILNTVQYPIAVKNISTTGLLVKVVNPEDTDKFRSLVNNPVMVELDLPELSLSATAEVIRIVKTKDENWLALKFTDDDENIDNVGRRNSIRKNVFGTGYILINDQYIEFNALNTSETGAKIFFQQKIDLEINAEVVFKFEKMDLAGRARIKWIDNTIGNGTMVGLGFLEKFTSTAS